MVKLVKVSGRGRGEVVEVPADQVAAKCRTGVYRLEEEKPKRGVRKPKTAEAE